MGNLIISTNSDLDSFIVYFSINIWHYRIIKPPFHFFQIYSSFSSVANPALRYMSRVGTIATTS